MEENEDAKKKRAGYALGQDLAELSVEELDELVQILGDEISRIKETRNAKSDHLSAAEALFGSKN